MLRRLFTYIMLLSTLFTHAQCMQVHHSDGWTETIPVDQIDRSELLKDPVLVKIAETHNRSVVQVILRWHYQRHVVAIPGSSNPDHIKENISIFDFALTDEEMAEIAALNRNEKHDWY